jgi:polyphosphate kinase 2
MTQEKPKSGGRRGARKAAIEIPRMGNGQGSDNGADQEAIARSLVSMVTMEQALDEELVDMQREAAPGDASEFPTKPKRVPIKKADFQLNGDDLLRINTSRGLLELLRSKNIKVRDIMSTLKYEEELVALQVELVKLQRWVQEKGRRVAILFEGRDAAGKGGTIRRFTEHLNPRSIRVVALPKPTAEECGQWYFQRYSKQLPNAGEIVFFDRSWYNRAVVEPVNKFCTAREYERFMQQVPEYEHMLYEDGITIVKFWFSISKEEQLARFRSRRINPLKQWKLSPIDEKAQDLWDDYTHYKELMFSKTHTSFSPWIIVKSNNKKLARLESIRHVLNVLDYPGKEDAKVRIAPDPDIVTRFHRNVLRLD